MKLEDCALTDETIDTIVSNILWEHDSLVISDRIYDIIIECCIRVSEKQLDSPTLMNYIDSLIEEEVAPFS